MNYPTPYLDSLRSRFGLRRSIAREELRDFLVCLSRESGLDLAGWTGSHEKDATGNARRVANLPRGITFLSLGGQVRDIQYDEPGSMHPGQQAELSFVSTDLARGNHDADGQSGGTMDYLRRHASRVVVVTGEQLQAPAEQASAVIAPPCKSPFYCPSCQADVMAINCGDETKCPACDSSIGEYFL